MSFKIETTKNGKSLLLLDNYKYRDSYSKKCDDVVWRCLGKSCKASVCTDINKTSVVVHNNKHTGPHPITMRSLQSPFTPTSSHPTVAGARSANPLSPATSSLSTSAVASIAPPASNTTPANNTTPAPHTTELLTQILSVEHSACSSGPSVNCTTAVSHVVADLQAENLRIKNEVLQLRSDYKTILDHAIESDTRLLQFTDEIFVANSSHQHDTTSLSVIDDAVQCDIPETTGCSLPGCIESRDLVTRLRTTIEVLEAELESLRSQTGRDVHFLDDPCADGEWRVYQKKQNFSIPTKNSFQPLNNILDKQTYTSTLNGNISLRNNAKFKQKKCNQSRLPNLKQNGNSMKAGKPKIKPGPPQRHQFAASGPLNQSLSSELVTIHGHSHARYLASLVQSRLPASTRVTGVCKPGAKLLQVTSGDRSFPGGCHVLLAGSNDIAAGESCNIFQHLEKEVEVRLSSAAVVLVTVPHRHDLPAHHPVNQETVLVNQFITELSIRNPILQVVDINTINRRWFTRHGMHLRMPGKRLLAGLIVDCLMRASPTKPPHGQPISVSVDDQSTPAVIESRPITLPHETYADALKLSSPAGKNSKESVAAVVT